MRDDPWAFLRRHTTARIALGRTGDALPTARLLEFQRAHAEARDAVHAAFEPRRITAALPGQRFAEVHSAAADRSTYLQRPDLGRRLATALPPDPCDAVFVVGDGLSARAVHDHAAPLLAAALPCLAGWRLAPIVLAHQARVALGDQIALALGARLVAMLIGERPGLSAADSLGVYLTWAPRPDTTDAERNCISNIRPGGMSIAAAAELLVFLMHEARRLGLTGISLKADGATGRLPPPPC